MPNNYKVFIGSTYRDLADYRQAAIETCNMLGLIPIGMEFFEAMGKGATVASKSKLAEADVYVGIFAFRYGYCEEGFDKSVTEIEYDYAGERKLDRLCFIVDPTHEWRPDFTEVDKYPELQALKAKVEKEVVRNQFTSVDNFALKLMHSLVKWLNEQTKPGALPTETDKPHGSISAIIMNTTEDIISRAAYFVARTGLMKDTIEHLEKGKQVLLQGLGGSGKTALAEEITAYFIQQKQGPVLWMRAGQEDFHSLYSAILLAFDVRPASALSDAARKQQLKQLFQVREVRLVVLDEAWNAQALLQILKTMPDKFPILVTSRQRYPLDEILPVGVLSKDKAFELLGHHAHQNYQQDEAAANLCEHLEYLAFAIEIAGKTLYVTNENPADLLKRIEMAPQNLAVPHGFAEIGREKVADLLAVSLENLDPNAQQVFWAFGAFFSPSLTPELAAIYLQLDLQKVKANLNTLFTNSLAERRAFGDHRASDYRLHSLSYSYALAGTKDSDHRHAVDACLGLLRQHNEPTYYPLLRAELDNFLRAAEWALEKGGAANLGKVREFADLLYRGPLPNATHGFLDLQGYPHIAAKFTECAIKAAEQQDDLAAEAGYLANLGSIYRDLGDLKHAVENYQQARRLFQKLEDRHGEAITRTRLGNVYSMLGHSQKAAKTLEKALAIIQALNDPRWHAITLNCLGSVYRDLWHDLQQPNVVALHQQALAIAKQIGDTRTEGVSLQKLGIIHRNLRQYELAIQQLQQSHAIAVKLSDKRMASITLSNLGQVYRDKKEYSLALDHLRQALDLTQQIGDKRGESAALAHLASVYQFMEELNRAISLFEKAAEICQAIHDREGEAINLGRLGDIYFLENDHEIAMDYYQRALKLDKKSKNWRRLAITLRRIGDVHLFKRDYHEAFAFFLEALDICEKNLDDKGIVINLSKLGQAYFHKGKYGLARDHLLKAILKRQTLGDDHHYSSWQAEDTAMLGQTYYKLKRWKEALNYLEQARQLFTRLGIDEPTKVIEAQLDKLKKKLK